MNIRETITSYYDLSILKNLDPRDNGAMASILTGMYVVHTRADDRLHELRGTLPRKMTAWANLIATLRRRDNLDTVSRLVGRRTLDIIDISQDRNPICYKDFNPLDRVRGRLEMGPNGYPLTFHEGILDKLQVVSGLFHKDWYTVEVAGGAADNYEPLVEITIK